MPAVKVAIVDVGSNSVRLLVASVKRGDVTAAPPRPRLRASRRRRVRPRPHRRGEARGDSASRVDASRGSRGRRAPSGSRRSSPLPAGSRRTATSSSRSSPTRRMRPVVVLTADDEGRLAWEGAVARMEDPPDVVAVVDLGGGSCELAVGTPRLGPAWVRSVDAGALRVTRAFLGGDPPSAKRIAKAEREMHGAPRELRPAAPGRGARGRRYRPRDRAHRRAQLRARRARGARGQAREEAGGEADRAPRDHARARGDAARRDARARRDCARGLEVRLRGRPRRAPRGRCARAGARQRRAAVA